MKRVKTLLPALLLAATVFTGIGCRPNGDNNSTDANNEVNEGRTDSTKMPEFGAGQQADTIATGDTSASRDTATNRPR